MLGFLKVIYSGLVSMTTPTPPPLSPNLYIRRKTNPILIQFLSNLSKIQSQKTADIIF